MPATLGSQPNVVFLDASSSPSAYLNVPAHAFRVFVGEFDRHSQPIARACHFRLERNFTLMQFIDLLDRASIRILDRPRSQVVAEPDFGARYRLSQWVMLSAPFNDVRHYKALGLMSIQAMDAQSLEKATGLSAAEVTALLTELKNRQMLRVSNETAPAPRADGPITTTAYGEGASSLLGKLKRWVFNSRGSKHSALGPHSGTFTITRRQN